MLGDASGLTDTMWDLIVDGVGAGVLSIAAYIYMERRETSVVEEWIQSFIEGNPRLFSGSRRGERPPDREE